MKIFIIGRSYPSPKSKMMGIFEFEQAAALNRAGHDVSYLYCDLRSVKHQRQILKTRRHEQGVALFGANIPLEGLPQKILFRIRESIIIQIIKEAIQEKGVPDIIHFHFPLLTMTEGICDYLYSLSSKLIITEHWTAVQDRSISPTQEVLLLRVVKQADLFLCVSDVLRDSILQYTKNHYFEKIRTVPNIVNDTFQRTGTKVPHPFSFLFLGRIEPVKRCDMLIRAFEEAFDKDTAVELCIAGNGSQLKKLQIIKKSMNDSRIHLLGLVSREDVPILYENADVCVSASALETFGVPFAEAWMSGLPIICANSIPICAYLQPGVNGRTFSDNSQTELAQCMRQIKEEYHQYDSEKIADYAKSVFSESVIIHQIETAYKEVI